MSAYSSSYAVVVSAADCSRTAPYYCSEQDHAVQGQDYVVVLLRECLGKRGHQESEGHGSQDYVTVRRVEPVLRIGDDVVAIVVVVKDEE